MKAPIPHDEAMRLAALAKTRVLDSAPEESFQDFAHLASEICSVPVALVSLVDSDRQWFKARVGFEPLSTHRDLSFCAHAILAAEPLVVPDTQTDPRFADNPLVTGPPHFRFYAGVPLLLEKGSGVGTLCVLDHVPRTLTKRQIDALGALARQIVRELQLRSQLADAAPVATPIAHTADSEDAVDPVSPGDLIGRDWRIVRRLGRGSVGAVYEARSSTGVRVAIKILLPAWAAHPVLVERFVREARVMARLSSPHIVRLLDVGNLEPAKGGLPFLIMEYLEGTDLHQLLIDRVRVPWREAIAWVADVSRAIAQAHEAGVIHRDLKPSNIFLATETDTTGTHAVVKILDFGIAKLSASEATPARAHAVTRHDTVLGTPQYMAPEQLTMADDVDARVDVWSMGTILHELISGRPAFDGRTSMELFAAILARPALPLRALCEGVPAGVQEIVDRCLRKDRAARYPSMRELLVDLEAAANTPDA